MVKLSVSRGLLFVALSGRAVGASNALPRTRDAHLGFVVPVGRTTRTSSTAFVPPSTTSKSLTSRNSHVDLFRDHHQGGNGAVVMVAAEMSGGAAASTIPIPKEEPSSGVSVGTSIFNLVKNVVGAGILAIPGGVTAFSQSKTAVFPAVAMIVALGSLSGYCFSLIGRVCAATGATSYGDAWAKTIGKGTAWLPSSSCTFKTFFACMIYSIIIGDVFSDVLKAFGAPGVLAARTNILCLVSSTVLLPLCLLKDLSALSYTSIVGVLGTVYTATVMGIRYFDKSYAEGGKFFAGLDKPSRPVFSGSGALNPLALILVSMLSTAFVAHFNAPKFYTDLKNKSVERYNSVVIPSFAAAIGFVVVMTLFPFLTFGGACKSFILNNYATSDRLATSCRVAIATSIVGGFPLVFMPAKTGALSLLGVDKPTEFQRKLATVLLLATFTAIGVVLTDLGFVVSFAGAVLGSALVFIFPSLMWINKCRREAQKGVVFKGWRRAELVADHLVAGLGVALAVLGGGLSIKKSFF